MVSPIVALPDLQGSNFMKLDSALKTWKTVTCICPIVKNPRARNSRTCTVIMTMKRDLNMYNLPQKKFQVPI
jgi:hypothetical protein